MKIEWLVANVTAIRFLDRAESAMLGVIVAGHVFGQSSHLMKIEWLVTDVTAIGSPWQSGTCIFGCDFD